MIFKLPPEVFSNIARYLTAADVARVETALNARLHEDVWRTVYPHEYSHRPVEDKIGYWKNANYELELMRQGQPQAMIDLKAAQSHLQAGTRIGRRRAIALAQPMPPEPADIVPRLRVLHAAMTAEGRTGDANRIQERIKAESSIDDAIENNDVTAVAHALESGARPTFRRLGQVMTGAFNVGQDRVPMLEVMCRHIAQRGLAPKLESAFLSTANAAPAGPARSYVNAVAFAVMQPGHETALEILLRAGFKLRTGQAITLAKRPDPRGLFAALNAQSVETTELAIAVFLTCSEPNLQMRRERLTQLTRAGARVDRSFLYEGFAGRAGLPNTFRPALTAPVIALSLSEPVRPLLEHLQTLGAPINSASPDGFNAWHGLAVGNATDSAAVAAFLHSQGVAINQRTQEPASLGTRPAWDISPLGLVLAQSDGTGTLVEDYLRFGANPKGFQMGGQTAWNLANNSNDQTTLTRYGAIPTKAVLKNALLGPIDFLETILASRPHPLAGANAWPEEMLADVAADTLFYGSPVGKIARLELLFDHGLSRRVLFPRHPLKNRNSAAYAFAFPDAQPLGAIATADCLSRPTFFNTVKNCGADLTVASSNGANAWHHLAFGLRQALWSENASVDAWQSIFTHLSELGIDITAAAKRADGTFVTPLHMLLQDVPDPANARTVGALRAFIKHGALVGQEWAANHPAVLLAQSSEETAS